MALLQIESFEGTTTAADLTNRGWTLAGSGVVNSAIVRSGLRAWDQTSNPTLTFTAAVADRNALFVMGGACRPRSGNSPSFRLLGPDSAIVAQWLTNPAGTAATLTTNGTLRQTVDLTPLGWQANDYNFVELRCQVGGAGVGAAGVWLNGAQVLSFSGAITANSSVIASAQWFQDWYLDDLYVLNGAGTHANNRLGDVRALALYPTGDGYSTSWTPSTGTDRAAVVNETARNTTNWIASSTVGAINAFALADLPANVTAVHGVRIIGYLSKSDAGARIARLGLRSGGTNQEGTDKALGTSWSYFFDLYPTNPFTGLAWTPAQINALEAFVKVQS